MKFKQNKCNFFLWFYFTIVIFFSIGVGSAYADNPFSFTIGGSTYDANQNVSYMPIPFMNYETGDEHFNSSKVLNAFSMQTYTPGVLRIIIPNEQRDQVIELYKLGSVNKLIRSSNGHEGPDNGLFCAAFFIETGDYAVLYENNSISTNKAPLIKFDFFPVVSKEGECSSVFPTEILNCQLGWVRALSYRYLPAKLDEAKAQYYKESQDSQYAEDIRTYRLVVDHLLTYGSILRTTSLDRVEVANKVVFPVVNQIQKDTLGLSSDLSENIASKLYDHASALAGLFIPPPDYYSATQTLIGDIGEIIELAFKTTDLYGAQKTWNNIWIAKRVCEDLLQVYNGDWGALSETKGIGSTDLEDIFQFYFDNENEFRFFFPDPFDKTQSIDIFHNLLDNIADDAELLKYGYLSFADVDGDNISNLDEIENGTDPNDPLSPEPKIEIYSPTSSTVVNKGGYIHVSWSSSYLKDTFLKIELVGTDSHILNSSVSLEGSYNYIVPSLAEAGSYYIKISDKNNSSVNAQSSAFQILEAPACTDDICLFYPEGGETLTPGETYRITWDYTLGDGESEVSIILRKGGEFERSITSTVRMDQRYFDWEVPITLEQGSDYQIQLKNFNYTPTPSDQSGSFSITAPPEITVLNPTVEDEVHLPDSKMVIKWTTTGSIGEYLKIWADSMDDDLYEDIDIAESTENAKSFSWIIPEDAYGQYNICVRSIKSFGHIYVRGCSSGNILIPPPKLFVDQTTINLGAGETNSNFQRSFIIKNTGSGLLSGNIGVDAIHLNAISHNSFNLYPGETIIVNFEGNYPAERGPFSFDIPITSNGGDTNISVNGVAERYITWESKNNPITVDQETTFETGTRLIIKPGTEVQFVTGGSVIVEGVLVARGTADKPIRFNSDQPNVTTNEKPYIMIKDTSTDAKFDSEGNYVDGTIIENVIIENASGENAKGAIEIESSSPYVHGCIIKNNNTTGIFVNCSSPTISNNIFENNTNGIVINNCDCSQPFNYYNFTRSIVIENNVIKDNQINGIEMDGQVSGTIMSNSISNNRNGIFLVDSCYLYNFFVSRNIISENSDWGINAPFGSDFMPDVIIDKNIILNNFGGGINGAASSKITNNIIAGNRGRGYSFNEWCSWASCPLSEFSGNSVIYNIADYPIFIYLPSAQAFSQNTITQNETISSSIDWPDEATIYMKLLDLGSGIYGSNIFNNNSQYDLKVVFPIPDPNWTEHDYISGWFVAPIWWGYPEDPNNNFSDFNLEIMKRIFNEMNTIFMCEECETLGDTMDPDNMAYWDCKMNYCWYNMMTPYPSVDAPLSPPIVTRKTITDNANTIAWNFNPEINIQGYRIYYDTDSGYPYSYYINVGNVTEYSFEELDRSKTWHFTLTALSDNSDGVDDWFDSGESWFSKEIVIIGSIKGDLDLDNDTDGKDIFSFLQKLETGMAELNIEEFAAEFGK